MPENTDPENTNAANTLGVNSALSMVYTTCPTLAVAEAIAETLVRQKLIACANILPAMRAIYVWQDALQKDDEVVMLLKTQSIHTDKVVNKVVELHPYDTPAVLVLPVSNAAAGFANWVKQMAP